MINYTEIIYCRGDYSYNKIIKKLNNHLEIMQKCGNTIISVCPLRTESQYIFGITYKEKI